MAEFAAFGDAKKKSVHLLLTTCQSGAEHFDLLIPRSCNYPGIPVCVVQRKFFLDILRGEKTWEFRDQPASAKAEGKLTEAKHVVVRAGRTPGYPYMVVEVDKTRPVPLEEVIRRHGDVHDFFKSGHVLGLKLGRIVEVVDHTDRHYFRVNFSTKISPLDQAPLTREQKMREEQVPLSFTAHSIVRRPIRELQSQTLAEAFHRFNEAFVIAKSVADVLTNRGHKPLLWQNDTLSWQGTQFDRIQRDSVYIYIELSTFTCV